MKNFLSNIKSRLYSLAHSTKGIAAVEFAMVLPLLVLICFGSTELLMRVQAYDKFTRYTLQFGDLIGRYENGQDNLDMGELTTSEIQSLYDFASNNILGDSSGHLEITISSVGFDASDGEPKLLWTRAINNGTSLVNAINPSDYIGLGEPLESILVIKSGLKGNTPISFISNNFYSSNNTQSTHQNANGAYEYYKEAVFRPRTVRALAIDGIVAESNTDWDR